MKVLLVGGAGHVGTFITPYLRPRHTPACSICALPPTRGWSSSRGPSRTPRPCAGLWRGGRLHLAGDAPGAGGLEHLPERADDRGQLRRQRQGLAPVPLPGPGGGGQGGVYTSTMSVHFRKREAYPAEELMR